MPLNLPKLTRQGYDTSTPQRAMSALMAYVAKRPQAPLQALANAIPLDMSDHQLAHFVGQACHESESFRFLRELWGPTPTQLAYEGRRDLGNTEPGDGFKYRGRGIFQITGRANYSHMAKVLNLPLVEHPELLEMPDHAVASALAFWDGHGLSGISANSDVRAACELITRRINGGSNGLDDRLQLTQKAFSVLS